MKYFFTLFIALLTYFGIFAQESNSLLWEIKGKKVKSPSYLFGTMHLIPQENFLFPESLKEKVKNSELLIMEIGGISEQLSAAQFIMLKEGSLFDFFAKEQRDSLFNYFENTLNQDISTVISRYSNMKPMVLLQLFTQEAFGENPASYDISLEAIARKNNVKIEGLETIEQQIGFFDKMTVDEQVKMVMTALRNTDNSKAETEKLIALYLNQNIDSLAIMISNSETGSDSFEEEFLTNRNADWIPQIKTYVKKNSCFIAVGAGHLGGPNGVVPLLRKEGYTVEPVLLKSTHP
ncbi:MAG: TraB/GumN family protein [Crocinitomicaceae bacterium]|nr:TraB/GumN family protein [Crocinitomicaceae bacterium]